MVTTRRTASRSGVERRANASLRRSAAARTPTKRGAGESRSDADVATRIYSEMLVEADAGAAQTRSRQDDGDLEEGEEPPAKRLKRPGEKMSSANSSNLRGSTQGKHGAEDEGSADDDDEDDDDVEFEDVQIPAPVIQTAELDSDDESDDEELPFEDIDLSAIAAGDTQDAKPKDMEINLTAHSAALPQRPSPRKKAISRAERERRIEVHKMHVLCLLAHAETRNRYCNDHEVQAALRPLLTDKMIKYLNPGSNLSQFGRTESLKNGIQQVSAMWKLRFGITERGIKRALWAEDEAHLDNYHLPSDLDSAFDRDEFRKAAKTLTGSRDVGAQLFCALLRVAGVETRLVCSLQVLSFAPRAPTMLRPKKSTQRTPTKKPPAPIPEIYRKEEVTFSPSMAVRRRLGHPQATAYRLPASALHSSATATAKASSSSSSSATPVSKEIRNESPFPVYWVEVLDVAHQKWAPVDPLVTCTQWKPAKLEPPASDRSNSLSYAIAFSADAAAKDVTRRYAKAYSSKTRRTRIDGLEPATTSSASTFSHLPSSNDTTANSQPLPGHVWLRRALSRYRDPYPSDLDQIEDRELAATEGREPMPRNVADFKDHPVYALERHLRRSEVIPDAARMAGTVSAGSRAPLERVYRRRDVRVCRSADKWYRLGRVVRDGEIPAKWAPRQRNSRRRRDLLDDQDDDDDQQDEDAGIIDPVLGTATPNGIPLFTPEQTDAYEAPPVVDGVVPKNKFGNLDVYVPSMVPRGGAHIVDPLAARAAFLLGIDYAPALTGFEFRGRKGTAVLRGAVVPIENEAAVRAVVAGFADLQDEIEAERMSRVLLRAWARFLMMLRIRRRVRAAAEERGEELEEDELEAEGGVDADDVAEAEAEPDAALDAESEDTEEYDIEIDDEDAGGGGGFIVD